MRAVTSTSLSEVSGVSSLTKARAEWIDRQNGQRRRAAVAPDGVVMRDRAAAIDHGISCNALDLVPLFELRAAPCRRQYREIWGRTVRIHVREPAGHATAAAYFLDRLLRCACHGGVES